MAFTIRDTAKQAGIARYAENVPIGTVEPYMEFDRRPGQPNAHEDQEYWDKLKAHISENGFEDPITLEYHPESGTGKIGEGNHRIGVAKELGLTHVPMMVYRRSTPLEHKIHEPGTYDTKNRIGIADFPQYAKPSHIGFEGQPYEKAESDWYKDMYPDRFSKTRVPFYSAAKNPNKFLTTIKGHRAGKAKHGLPKPHNTRKVVPFPRRKSMAMDPEVLADHIAKHGPYMFHGTDSIETKRAILNEGLIPQPGGYYDGELESRPDHAYVGNREYVNQFLARPMHHMVGIDLRKLDPERVNPDEDHFTMKGDRLDQLENPDHTVRTHHAPDGKYPSYGTWAEANNLGADPGHTHRSLLKGSLAIRGGVDPGAIVDAKQAVTENAIATRKGDPELAITASWAFEASKLEWLQERPDKFRETSQGQDLLKWMERNPEHDHLFPWIWTNARKGELMVGEEGVPHTVKKNQEIDMEAMHKYEKDYQDKYGTIPFRMRMDEFQDHHDRRHDPDGTFNHDYADTRTNIETAQYAHLHDLEKPETTRYQFMKETPEQDASLHEDHKLDRWSQFIKDKKHPIRQGVNPDQLNPEGLDDLSKQWHFQKNNSTPVHHYNNGWSVRQLTNRKECQYEGDEMGHCAGGYAPEGNEDRLHLFSLRDKQNKPHATIEVAPGPKNLTWCQHCDHELPLHEHTCPNCHEHNEETTTQNGGEIGQIQGKENAPPIEKYQKMLKHFFLSHYPEDERPRWADQHISTLDQIPGYAEDNAMAGITYHPGDYGVGSPDTHTDYTNLIDEMTRGGHYHEAYDNDGVGPVVAHAHRNGELDDLEGELENRHGSELDYHYDNHVSPEHEARTEFSYTNPEPEESDHTEWDDDEEEYKYDEEAHNKARQDWEDDYEDWKERYDREQAAESWDEEPMAHLHMDMSERINTTRWRAQKEEKEERYRTHGQWEQQIDAVRTPEDARTVYMNAHQIGGVPNLGNVIDNMTGAQWNEHPAPDAVRALGDHTNQHFNVETQKYEFQPLPLDHPDRLGAPLPAPPQYAPGQAAFDTTRQGRTADMDDEWDGWDDGPPEEYLQEAATIRPLRRGDLGKGIIETSGKFHTWATNEYGEPHHDEVAAEKRLSQAAKVDIFPSGAASILSPDEQHLFGMSREDAETHLQREAPRHGLHFNPGHISKRDTQRQVGGVDSQVDPNTGWTDLGEIVRDPSTRGTINTGSAVGTRSVPAGQKMTHRRIVADKMHDFLLNPKARPDLQTPEAQEFLNTLKDRYHNDKTDPLMPWLTREWKKGRLLHKPDTRSIGVEHLQEDAYPPKETITPERLNHWADWYHSNHPSRQGVDIMQLKHPDDLHERTKQWDEDMKAKAHEESLKGGEIAHKYDDGWSLRRLENGEQCKAEGDAMGHCVGGYGNSVESGSTMIYSLRDEKNSPHATMEIEPQHHTYDIEKVFEQKPGSALPDDLQQSVRNYHHWKENPEGEEPTIDGDLPALHETLLRQTPSAKTPRPHKGKMIQVQGKSNMDPKPEYKERLKQWFHTFPEEDRPLNHSHDEDEGFYGHDGYYHSELDHPEDIEQYKEEFGAKPELGKTEDEYGLSHTKDPMPVNYEDLLSNIDVEQDHGYHLTHDKDHVTNIYELAKERGDIPELAKHAEAYRQTQDESLMDWSDQNFEYAPRYPDPDMPDGYEDEEGDDVDEDHPNAKPFWTPDPTGYNDGHDRVYDQEQAEKEYNKAQSAWDEQHAGSQASAQLYNHLAPHYWGPGEHPEDKLDYQNEKKTPEHYGLEPNHQEIKVGDLPPGSQYMGRGFQVPRTLGEGYVNPDMTPTHIPAPNPQPTTLT